MPMDAGSMVMISSLVLSLVVLVLGVVLQRRRTTVGRPLEVLPDEAVPGFEPPESEAVGGPPPLPSDLASKWWRVPSRLYNLYDLPLVFLLLALYLSPVVMELIAGKPEMQEMSMELAVGTVAIQFFMVALVTGFVAWRSHPVSWLGLKWRQWPLVIPISIFGVLFTWGVVALLDMSGFLDWLSGGDVDEARQDVVKAFTETQDMALLAMLAFLAVVVAPLSEEVLFRGYLYPVCKRFMGRWAGVIFSSLVFAAVHNNAQALIPLFVLAILLTLAYEWTGSIWAPIGMHTLFNGMTVLAQMAIRFEWIEAPTP
ncbi:MAG: type II CAAX endopeptidase family protein [Verrucomicrobiota bacterium]